MNPLHEIAEAKIREALEAGAFDDLPGQGQPLVFDEPTGVAPELRAAYSLLKGANCLPEELELRQHLVRLRDLIAATDDEHLLADLHRERTSAQIRYELLLERRQRPGALRQYAEALRRRLG